MEVHRAFHSERKKFTHYLWEFLMLFLAVFCGSRAEPSAQVKHPKGKTIYDHQGGSLESDTALLAECVAFWDNINNDIDSVFRCDTVSR